MMSAQLQNRKLIAIVGPTGSGKSDLAIKLAKRFNGEIICVDSRTVYRGMDIGTAKPLQAKSVPHYGLDLVAPDKQYTIAQFQKYAYKIIDDIFSRGKVPFLVGGTPLWMEAILEGYAIPKRPTSNSQLRTKLEKLSNAALLQKLKKLDPPTAAKIDHKNKRRLVRALEVCLLSEKPFSSQQKKTKPNFDALILGIEMPREKLYQRIDARVDKMFEAGLVDEVEKLVKKYSPDAPGFNAIGYREIIDGLKIGQNESQIKEQIKYNTHAFVRRQLTWWRTNKKIHWIKNLQEARKHLTEYLKK